MDVAIHPMVSESPPIDMANRRVSNALYRCKNAMIAIGTLP